MPPLLPLLLPHPMFLLPLTLSPLPPLPPLPWLGHLNLRNPLRLGHLNLPLPLHRVLQPVWLTLWLALGLVRYLPVLPLKVLLPLLAILAIG